MRLWLLSGYILAVLVTLTAIQAKDDTIPNGLKALDHFVGCGYNDATEKPENWLPVGRNHSIEESTTRTLKNRFILGGEGSQPDGVRSLWLMEADDEKKDSVKIQGTWAAVTYIKGGDGDEKPPSPEESGIKFLFEGDKITFLSDLHEGPIKGSFKLDATKTHKSIDITFPAPPGKKKDRTIQGIYKFDGDTLIICFEPYNLDGKILERPTEFKSKAGSETILATFKQLKK